MLQLPKTKLHRRIFKARLLREVAIWSFLMPAAFALTWFWLYPAQQARATVAANGSFFFGDSTNVGIMRSRTFTTPSTAGAEFAAITGNASNILWTVAKTAPTREEMMIGSLRVDGELQLESCATGCDATGDFTNQWANVGATGTQDCDNAGTADTCFRAFDIGYEALSGKAMVAYADNVADKFYYALWDNSAWAPDSSPASPSATNEVDFDTGGTGGTPQWIRVVPMGENLDTDRSNRIMVLISDTNEDLWGCYWDGSTFSCLSATLEGSLQNCSSMQCFDGAWQDNDTFIVTYFDTAASTQRYQIYTVGSGWGGEQDGVALGSAGYWMQAVADPTSTRIAASTSESGNDTRNIIWRTDNSTNGWTACSGGTDCPDATTETVGGQQASVAFERFSGEALHVYNDAGTSSSTDYVTYTAPTTWGNATGATITTADDVEKVRSWGSPNSDDIMIMTGDIDCDIDAKLWTGAGLSTLIAGIEVASSHMGGAAGCDVLTTPGTPPSGAANNFDFAWKIYSPWQRNWRFYDGADTASVPTTALANENTAPSSFNRTNGKFRLRINYSERGTQSSTDSRLKLQYTSGCNPNSALELTCTWVDVDDAGGGGKWRFADIACTPTDCADGALLTGTVFTETNATCTAGNGCGTWVEDKDAAAGTNMDHNGSIVQESEWIVEANAATGGTTYYFRVYNVDQVTPLYREQDNNDCGGGAAACTYPSLTTDGTAGPTTDDVMRHGNWFSGGSEQSLFWVD